jgi:threonine dehydratase
MKEIYQAYDLLEKVVTLTPLSLNLNLSDEYEAQVFLKREDLQLVRSYKLRGAYNKISHLSELERANGIVCASAGNHAQGVAFSCNVLKIHGKIYMPVTTPKQKTKQVQLFGKSFVEIVLIGDTFDDAYNHALKDSEENKKTFIHPFDDEKVIAGQGTVGLEILNQIKQPIDYLFLPVGGGGLAAGVSTIFKAISPNTKIIGVEPEGAPSMKTSIDNGYNTALEGIDKFVDGAAVKRVGDKTFEICRKNLDNMVLIPEGKVCSTILRLYNEEAIVAEPAGALTISALDFYKDEIKGKTVVCVVSGGNNDITRTEEIKERSLFYEGLKHYFIITFAQRPGALREFLNEVLGPTDDISYFQFDKKNNRTNASAVVGLELKNKEDFRYLKQKMDERNIEYKYLNERADLFTQLV